MQADWPVWQHCNSELCCQAEAQKARSDPPLSQWMYHTWPESKPASLSLLTSAIYSAGVGAGKGWTVRTGIESRWWDALIDNQGSRFSLHSPHSRLKQKHYFQMNLEMVKYVSRWGGRRQEKTSAIPRSLCPPNLSISFLFSDVYRSIDCFPGFGQRMGKVRH